MQLPQILENITLKGMRKLTTDKESFIQQN